MRRRDPTPRWRRPSPFVDEERLESVFLDDEGRQIEIVLDRTSTDGYVEQLRNGPPLEQSVRWASRYVDDTSLVVDLGACVGAFALPIAHRCRHVIAVEAMPDNAALLTASAARCEARVTPVHAAIWDRLPTVRMSDRSAWARAGGESGIVVPTATFGDVLRIHADGPVDLVKVDIEGSEAIALRQIIDATAAQDDLVVIYESNQAVTDTDVRSLHELADAAGFDLWYLDHREGDARPVDITMPQYTLNVDVLAVRGSRHPRPSATPTRSRPQGLADLAEEIERNPITICRSYAWAVVGHLGESVDVAMPQHDGAHDEIERFARILTQYG